MSHAFQTNGAHTNGAAAHSPQAWLKQTVQQFFGSINWDNHPPEIQSLRLASQNNTESLSLFLTVNQFFSAINWEGNDWAGNGAAASQPSLEPLSDAEADAFTLENFSDLF